MASKLVDERDVRFVLFEQLEVERLTKTKKFSEANRDLFEMVLNEAHKLAETVLAPTNADGDKIGARYVGGKVALPDSFKQAYKQCCEGGWVAPTDDPEVGGQGLPMSVFSAANEMLHAGNAALNLYLGLNHGAGKLIELYGTPDQKAKYLPKMYSGEWGGTMCLTEASAGSDLAHVKTKAIRLPDGRFKIEGDKQFITGGDHDLTDNIIHPVLARIEGDPPGVKGISIFVVPKFRVNDDGSLGQANDVDCTGIEHKMGIKGSATCSLAFGSSGQCVGELLGQERQGILIMFNMMNEERLNVGVQAQGIASAAFRAALQYSKERLQGADISTGKVGGNVQVPIIKHPDIRRSLMMMRSYVDGMRALLYYTGLSIDRREVAEGEKEKALASGLVELLTPLCKAYCSDRSYEVCETAIQVLGGYGYCQEYPVEQNARDTKICSIYEGTNGIQAIDFFNRKLPMRDGEILRGLLADIEKAVAAAKKVPDLADYGVLVEQTMASFVKVVGEARKKMKEDIACAFIHVTPLLEAAGDLILGWMHLWQATIALEKLEALADGGIEKTFYMGKVATAKFFIGTILPITQGKLASIQRCERAAIDIPEEAIG